MGHEVVDDTLPAAAGGGGRAPRLAQYLRVVEEKLLLVAGWRRDGRHYGNAGRPRWTTTRLSCVGAPGSIMSQIMDWWRMEAAQQQQHIVVVERMSK